jgi:hypothetical protein
MNTEYKITFKNIPYNTKCLIQKKNGKYNLKYLFIDGTRIFECNKGDIIKFRNIEYENLNLKVLETDNIKTFDMVEEFEVYQHDKHSFIENFFRSFRK